jgi:uncharacterized protein YcfJ
MRPIIGAAVAALAIGGAVVLATSRNSSNVQALNQPSPVATIAPAPTAPAALAPTRPANIDIANPPVARTVYRDRVVYRTPTQRVVVKKRSTKKSVAIIGGSTVGGAVVGGLIGGKKGAVIGGVVAGTAGTVYDRKTRKKKVPVE